jgi:hypothetical protein
MKRIAVLALISTFVGFGCASQAKKNTMDAGGTSTTAPKTLEKSAPMKAVSEAKVAKTESKAKSRCSVKGDVRVIDVRAKDKGCELAYEKSGAESVVATSISGTDHCQEVADKIKAKLTAAGFSCD